MHRTSPPPKIGVVIVRPSFPTTHELARNGHPGRECSESAQSTLPRSVSSRQIALVCATPPSLLSTSHAHQTKARNATTRTTTSSHLLRLDPRALIGRSTPPHRFTVPCT